MVSLDQIVVELRDQVAGEIHGDSRRGGFDEEPGDEEAMSCSRKDSDVLES